MNTEKNKTHNLISNMAKIALMAALTCILGPLSIPIGPIPISLTVLAVFISVYTLGMYRGTISYIVYILLGFVGLPVFAGFTSGPQKLFSLTGGYIIGLIFMALICGFFIDKFEKKIWLHFVGMILGLIVCYTFGTAWFVIVSDSYTVFSALCICVFPFIPYDIIKMVIASVIGIPVRKRLKSAGLF